MQRLTEALAYSATQEEIKAGADNLKERIRKFNEARLLKKDRKSDWVVKCPYCNDSGHLWVEYVWRLDRFIPEDAPISRYLDPAQTVSSVPDPVVAVRCDCNHDQIGEVGKESKVKRFQDYFGRSIQNHPHGRRILEYRREKSANPAPIFQGVHMHQSEAWEVMDRKIPDPPENNFEYQEADDELPPF